MEISSEFTILNATTSEATPKRSANPKRSKRVRFASDVTFIDPVQLSSSPSSMSGSESPLLCLETLLEDRHSDNLFNSEESDDDVGSSKAVLTGHQAKKTFQVKFGGLH